MPWWLGQYPSDKHPFVSGVVLLAVWSAIWTGLALWHAARREEKWWFVLFLLVHTAGVLELVYLIFVAKAFTVTSPAKKPSRKASKK